MLRLAALALVAFPFGVLAAAPAAAQGDALHDQPIAWRTYAAARQARVRVFASTSERRPTTVVVDDRAGNGAPVTDDAGFVADLIGRELGFDPTAATFVFRFTPAASQRSMKASTSSASEPWRSAWVRSCSPSPT